MALDSKSALTRARACIRIEMAALDATAKNLDGNFLKAADAIYAAVESGQKLIFSGVGKSAHIAQKLVGTFNSTGASSCFLDATQAQHGDLGLCVEGDVAILLSNSGQSEEILRLIPLLKRFGVRVIALTSQPKSDLGKLAEFQLIYRVPREACPLELAPTASTTAALALGDALAMVLLEQRGVTREDFARAFIRREIWSTPSAKSKDIMRAGDRLPVMDESGTLQEAILAMTKAKSGSIALVKGRAGKLAGILTDGDFRRSALSGPHFLSLPVSNFMTRSPKTISEEALGVEALRMFEKHKIDDLIVLNLKGQPVGLVDGQDLPKFKFV